MATQPRVAQALPLERMLAAWRWRHVALTLGVLALLGGALGAVPEISGALGTVGAIWSRPDLLSVFVISYSAAFYLRAVAWRVLLETGPSSLRLFGFLQAALLANHVLPTRAGELVRVGLLARTGTPLAQAASSTLVARMLDLGALCLLAMAFAPLAGRQVASPVGLGLPLVALAAGAAGLYALGSGRLGFVPAHVVHAAQSISPVRAAVAFGLTLPSWLFEALALWSVAHASGVPMPLELAVAATAFTIAFQGFQVTPGGLGVYEASLTGVLVLAGVDAATAFGLAVATHALKFAYSFAMGLPCLLIEVVADLGGAPRRVVAGLGRWVHPGLLLAAGAVAIGAGASVPAVVLGAASALPIAVLARRHFLPRALLFLLPVLCVACVAVLGADSVVPTVAAGAVVVGLVFVRVAGWSAVFWTALLTLLVGAGAVRPGEVAVLGLLAALGTVLIRQWWLSRRPLAPGAPLTGGAVGVVIPVADEAESIAHVLARIPRASLAERGFATVAIVVDDGSCDGSAYIARAAGADRVIQHTRRRGLGAAVRSGLGAARSVGCVAVAYLDGDGEYDAAEALRVLEPVLRGEADYVLGNRFPGARRTMQPSRLVGNVGFTCLQRVLTGRWIGDGQTGFRAFSARALTVAEIAHDYNYAQVLTLDLVRKGARLAEVPISYRPRRTGQSFVRYGEYARRVLPAVAREILSP